MKGQNLISLSLFRHIFKIVFRLKITGISDFSGLFVGRILFLEIRYFSCLYTVAVKLSTFSLSSSPHPTELLSLNVIGYEYYPSSLPCPSFPGLKLLIQLWTVSFAAPLNRCPSRVRLRKIKQGLSLSQELS